MRQLECEICGREWWTWEGWVGCLRGHYGQDTRDVDQAEKTAGWARLDLMDAKIRRQKGNYPSFAGYRQQGRAEARIAKKRRTRAARRIDHLLCQEGA